MRYARSVALCWSSLAVVVSVCVPAYAQWGGLISLYPDAPTYSECNLVEPPAVIGPPMEVYVVYASAPTTVRTAEFKIVKNWGAYPGAESWLPNATVGSTYLGIVVSNPVCQTTPWLLGTLQFFYDGVPAEPCTEWMTVVGSPTSASGEVEGTFCDYSIHQASGGQITINDDFECLCAVATEQSNWSKVKALYR